MKGYTHKGILIGWRGGVNLYLRCLRLLCGHLRFADRQRMPGAGHVRGGEFSVGLRFTQIAYSWSPSSQARGGTVERADLIRCRGFFHGLTIRV